MVGGGGWGGGWGTGIGTTLRGDGGLVMVTVTCLVTVRASLVLPVSHSAARGGARASRAAWNRWVRALHCLLCGWENLCVNVILCDTTVCPRVSPRLWLACRLVVYVCALGTAACAVHWRSTALMSGQSWACSWWQAAVLPIPVFARSGFVHACSVFWLELNWKRLLACASVTSAPPVLPNPPCP
jgi:hypothetical protein